MRSQSPGWPVAVLAALVARRHGLRFEDLSELVWVDGPPRTARPALHVHLSSLRKTLAAIPGAPEVRRTGSSYQLELNGWQIDVDLALELAGEASRIAPAPAARGAQLLDAALELWRGPAFTVDGSSVDELLTQRYELRRLDLEEDHVDALVHAAELTRAEDIALELVESQPYRERRWCQLMTVQVRRHRPDRALDTHVRVRKLLLDDLGVEPGEELQVLHHAVVTRVTRHCCAVLRIARTRSSSVRRSPSAASSAAATSSRWIESALALGTPVSVLGVPGVGKTRLVLELAEPSENRRPSSRVDGGAGRVPRSAGGRCNGGAVDPKATRGVAPARRSGSRARPHRQDGGNSSTVRG